MASLGVEHILSWVSLDSIGSPILYDTCSCACYNPCTLFLCIALVHLVPQLSFRPHSCSSADLSWLRKGRKGQGEQVPIFKGLFASALPETKEPLISGEDHPTLLSTLQMLPFFV